MLSRDSLLVLFNLAPTPEIVDGENIIPATEPGKDFKFFFVPGSEIVGQTIEIINGKCDATNLVSVYNGDLYIATIGNCTLGEMVNN